MNAAQLITGSDEWPLNAFAMPDGKPFYAGTYFPNKDWKQMLNSFVDLYQKNPSAFREQAAKVTQGIHAIENVPFNKTTSSFIINNLDANFKNLQPNIDYRKGGEKRSPNS